MTDSKTMDELRHKYCVKMEVNCYDGPDGVVRLERLEKLASAVQQWIKQEASTHYSADMWRLSGGIDQDNERVSRLKNKT